MEILSSEGIAKAINEACSSTTQNFFQNGKSCPAAKDLILRRGQPQDVPQILQCLKEGEILPTNPLHPPEKTNISEWSEEACRLDGVPNFFGLVLQQKSGTASGSCCGLVTFHFAYSTWDGRVLYLDRMILPTLDDTKALEFSVQYTLVEIAIRLSCARYTWQVRLPFNDKEVESYRLTYQFVLTLFACFPLYLDKQHPNAHSAYFAPPNIPW